MSDLNVRQVRRRFRAHGIERVQYEIPATGAKGTCHWESWISRRFMPTGDPALRFHVMPHGVSVYLDGTLHAFAVPLLRTERRYTTRDGRQLAEIREIRYVPADLTDGGDNANA